MATQFPMIPSALPGAALLPWCSGENLVLAGWESSLETGGGRIWEFSLHVCCKHLFNSFFFLFYLFFLLKWTSWFCCQVSGLHHPLSLQRSLFSLWEGTWLRWAQAELRLDQSQVWQISARALAMTNSALSRTILTPHKCWQHGMAPGASPSAWTTATSKALSRFAFCQPDEDIKLMP